MKNHQSVDDLNLHCLDDVRHHLMNDYMKDADRRFQNVVYRMMNHQNVDDLNVQILEHLGDVRHNLLNHDRIHKYDVQDVVLN